MGPWVHRTSHLVSVVILVLMRPIQVYEIESGSALVSTRGSLNEFLLRAVQLGGPPPAAWPRIWNIGGGHGNGMFYPCSLTYWAYTLKLEPAKTTQASVVEMRLGEPARLAAIRFGSLVAGTGKYFLTWSKK